MDLGVLKLSWMLLPGFQFLRLGWEFGLSPGRASDFSSKSTASRRDSVKWQLVANLVHVCHYMRTFCLTHSCLTIPGPGALNPKKKSVIGELGISSTSPWIELSGFTCKMAELAAR